MRHKLVFLTLFVLLLGAAVVAHFYVQSQVYHPVVRMQFPDGLSIAAVLPETKERQVCGAANDRFVAPFKQGCKECKVIAARCERDLEGVELAMRKGGPIPHPMVVARDVRIAVIGAPETAKLGCQLVAADMAAKGMRSAVCLPAQATPGKS